MAPITSPHRGFSSSETTQLGYLILRLCTWDKFCQGRDNAGRVCIGPHEFDSEMANIGGEVRRGVENLIQRGVYGLRFVTIMGDHQDLDCVEQPSLRWFGCGATCHGQCSESWNVGFKIRMLNDFCQDIEW